MLLGWTLTTAGAANVLPPDVLATMPPQGDAQQVARLGPALTAAVERWSRWPRVPALQVDALNLVEGGPALLSCLGEDACAMAAARALQARHVLFVRFSPQGISAALFDAESKRTSRAAASEDSPRAVELVVARLMVPALAMGTLEAPLGTALEVDGAAAVAPFNVEAGAHTVRVAGGAPQQVWVPPGGAVVLALSTADADSPAPRRRWPTLVLGGLAAGLVGVAVPVLLASGGLWGAATERHWTASQPERVGGSGVLRAYVEWQAVMLERAAGVSLAVAVALLLGAGLVGGSAVISLLV